MFFRFAFSANPEPDAPRVVSFPLAGIKSRRLLGFDVTSPSMSAFVLNERLAGGEHPRADRVRPRVV